MAAHDDHPQANQEDQADNPAIVPVSDDDQLLVEYLDDELKADVAENLEARLTQSPELRQRLQALQQSWDMLETLPRPNPKGSFVKSTIEMVVASQRRKQVRWHRWPIRVLATTIVFALLGMLGYQVVRYQQQREYRELVSNLEFVENIDYYLEINDIDFLVQLHEKSLFSEELENE